MKFLGASAVLLVSLTACTEDFGQFQFNGTGGAGSTTSQGGAGPTTSSTMVTTGSTTVTTGSTTVTTGSTTVTTGSTTVTTGSTTVTTGGGQATVPCGGSTCDVPMEVCCNNGTATDGCQNDPGSCNDEYLECNDDSDCPTAGDNCCAEKSGPDYVQTRCKASCGGNDGHVCDAGNQISTLPNGYFICP